MVKQMKCLALAAVVALAGCAGAKPQPQIGPSGHEASYAVSYPDQLRALGSEFSDREQEARAVIGEMKDYPSKLSDPDWAVVHAVVQASDASGRGHSYVERAREVRDVLRFFDEEKDRIGSKVAGSVAYVAQQKGCNVEAHGVVPHALNKAVQERLEDRLREKNDAFVLLARHRDSLGKQNATELETQADRIAYASFLTHVHLVDLRQRLQRDVEQADDVRKTIDDFIAAEASFQQQRGRTDVEKKRSEARVDAMRQAKAKVDASVVEANRMLEDIDQRLDQLQADYDQALAQLLSAIQSKQSAAGASS